MRDGARLENDRCVLRSAGGFRPNTARQRRRYAPALDKMKDYMIANGKRGLPPEKLGEVVQTALAVSNVPGAVPRALRQERLCVFGRTECVSRPASWAACCNARRNSSLFSWIEAIARPVATPNPTRAASDS